MLDAVAGGNSEPQRYSHNPISNARAKQKGLLFMVIRECKRCNDYFGTAMVWHAHRGKRGCKTAKALSREGFWRGYMDIWWSKDLGWDDTEESWWDESGQPIGDDKLLPIINT